ncbi:MAG: helix-turn-helix domain-containing protein [Lachnospiraceae bacterium]|nr:helix-turn-helix domain-containing protein [Lachnospiraceae bacterium]
MSDSASKRILKTPSAYTKAHYLYVQEVGTLKSLNPHISRREHLESFLFFIVTEGCGSVVLENTRYALHTGDCVFIDCRTPYSHESSMEAPWSLMWVHFHGSQAAAFYRLYREREGRPVLTPPSLTPYREILLLLYELQQSGDALSDLLSHRYLTDLIAQIFSDAFHGTVSSAIPEKFRNIRDYLEIHYAEKISLDGLSEAFYISKYHLLREYKRLFGTTIQNDLTGRRLTKAKSMLRFSRESIENIALSCGFQTASYFIKVFKQYENLTPLEYRKKW